MDGPVNVFEASAGLFPLLTGREPPFEAALDWLQFAYTADRAGAYVAPASTVLVPSAVAQGENCLVRFWHTSGDGILRFTTWETPWIRRLSAGRPRSERGKG